MCSNLALYNHHDHLQSHAVHAFDFWKLGLLLWPFDYDYKRLAQYMYNCYCCVSVYAVQATQHLHSGRSPKVNLCQHSTCG